MKQRTLRLYASPRRCALVLLFAFETDWTARHIDRAGYGNPLIAFPLTKEAEDYRAASYRATSLQYSGHGTQTAQGMREDLENLNFPPDQVQAFLTAAEPFWP